METIAALSISGVGFAGLAFFVTTALWFVHDKKHLLIFYFILSIFRVTVYSTFLIIDPHEWWPWWQWGFSGIIAIFTSYFIGECWYQSTFLAFPYIAAFIGAFAIHVKNSNPDIWIIFLVCCMTYVLYLSSLVFGRWRWSRLPMAFLGIYLLLFPVEEFADEQTEMVIFVVLDICVCYLGLIISSIDYLRGCAHVKQRIRNLYEIEKQKWKNEEETTTLEEELGIELD